VSKIDQLHNYEKTLYVGGFLAWPEEEMLALFAIIKKRHAESAFHGACRTPSALVPVILAFRLSLDAPRI
jgi:hypothetical protein